MPDREFWAMVYEDDDVIVEMLTIVRLDHGVPYFFVFQLTIRPVDSDEGCRQPIRRYDGAHGALHCDVYNRQGEQIDKIPLYATSMKDAADYAKHDLITNVQFYLEQYRRS